MYHLITQVLPEEMDVLCTHPMFGPESGQNGWQDFAFVYEKVRIRDEATCSSFLRIFESEVIKITVCFLSLSGNPKSTCLQNKCRVS